MLTVAVYSLESLNDHFINEVHDSQVVTVRMEELKGLSSPKTDMSSPKSNNMSSGGVSKNVFITLIISINDIRNTYN